MSALEQEKKRLSAFPKGAVQKATDLTYIAFDPREPGDADGGDVPPERVADVSESEAMLGEPSSVERPPSFLRLPPSEAVLPQVVCALPKRRAWRRAAGTPPTAAADRVPPRPPTCPYRSR